MANKSVFASQPGPLLPKATAMSERVARDFPNLKVLDTTSENESLGWVSERKADMTLRSLIVAAHTIKDNGWFNLKISGQIPGYENRLSLGVVRSETTLRDILSLAPFTKVVVVTGHGDQSNALKAVGLGAYDFYQKPVDVDTLQLIVQRAYQMHALEAENRRLAEALGTSPL